VSTIRFRSFKTIDLRARRPYTVLLLVAIGIILVTTHPQFMLVVMAYSYLLSAFVEMAVHRFRHRGRPADESDAATAQHTRDSAAG
jgi:phosphatidylserine synthase